jgi:DNA-binding NtrC family response regulator
VDVRVIAATNVDLRARITEGKFREDLFYRLNVVAIELPLLRGRRDDIPLLAYHFLQKYAGRTGREVRKISPEAMRLLQAQPWPGNVRELENAIEHAVVFCRKDTILPTDLPFARRGNRAPEDGASDGTAGSDGPGISLGDLPYRDAKQRAIATFELAYFSSVLQRAGGNVSEAARQAGLDRSNFRRAARRAGVSSRG